MYMLAIIAQATVCISVFVKKDITTNAKPMSVNILDFFI